MTQEPDIEAIAGKLTAAQRAFMLQPMYSAIHFGIAAAWFHGTGYWAARCIAKLGLAERRLIEPGYMASVPTPLGLAVRDHLLKGQRP